MSVSPQLLEILEDLDSKKLKGSVTEDSKAALHNYTEKLKNKLKQDCERILLAVMRKFAVVQWVSGEDAGMYSEMKTEAIRKYDDTKMDDDGYPQTDYSAAVEWQKGKKPKHGWYQVCEQCLPFDASSIAYSHNAIVFVQVYLNELVQIKEPYLEIVSFGNPKTNERKG
ncbi:LRR and PYD domains-containing 3-like protein [Labeo rohita]|uniref:LRR and PYD domains-containing 3-like protein n=1 Tax=Labeo rohita TaxID=84645 RepID=A0A498NQ51_LABRO|nr:LRR and PYD domains-containing 3-like protein [Labeo rohita]